ncbi:MAG: hypothetical protein ACQEQF_09550 [Bacillota bacterium]
MRISLIILAVMSWLISIFTVIPVEIGLIIFSVFMLLYALVGGIAEKAGRRYQIIYILFILYVLVKNLLSLLMRYEIIK